MKSLAQSTIRKRALPFGENASASSARGNVAGHPSLRSASADVDALLFTFLRSMQGLLRAVGLYQRNHPAVTESLETVERQLRILLAQISAVRVAVRSGQLFHFSPATNRSRPVGDPHGELRALADGLSQAGIGSIEFLQRTNLGELAMFAHAVDAARRAAGPLRRNPRSGRRDWSAWLAEHQIAGIRMNVPIERRDDAVLAGLISALLGRETDATEAEKPFHPTREQMRAGSAFLTQMAERLAQAQKDSPQEAARAAHAALEGAAPATLALMARGVAIDPPREDDSSSAYLIRVNESLALDYTRAEYRAARTRADEIRWLLASLCSADKDSEGEPRIEALVERFWIGMPAREKARVLADGFGWCLPVPVLRGYLDPLIAAVARGARASGREARRALSDFARGVESEEEKARRATAAALVELGDVLEQLWPNPQLANLSRRLIAALGRETSPGIAGMLAGVTETLSRLALARGAYAEFERILDALAREVRDAGSADIEPLERGIVAQDRWLLLVDAALANRPLDPVLPRLLRRDPERLIDRLGLLLTAPEGADLLPAMIRLVRAAGEPVLGALETHLIEPRRQRVATAVKLLTGVDPERLVATLPRAFCAWDWSLQDLAVTELTRQPAPALRTLAAHVFLQLLNEAHILVVPGMLDHIALTGDASAVPRLVEIAAGDAEPLHDIFVRIKAIEALGRMGSAEAAPLLRVLVRNRAGLTYLEPAGLRSAAEEALALIENRPGSVRVRQQRESVDRASAHFSRPRRYLRISPASPLTARLEGPHPSAARVRSIALGGAFLETASRLALGDSVRLEIQLGFGTIRPTAVVRNSAAAGFGVEFVHMSHKDREKLRRRIGRLQR